MYALLTGYLTKQYGLSTETHRIESQDSADEARNSRIPPCNVGFARNLKRVLVCGWLAAIRTGST